MLLLDDTLALLVDFRPEIKHALLLLLMLLDGILSFLNLIFTVFHKSFLDTYLALLLSDWRCHSL